jgi:hypothetical protein
VEFYVLGIALRGYDAYVVGFGEMGTEVAGRDEAKENEEGA